MALAAPASHSRGLHADLVAHINRPTIDAAGLPNEAYTSESFLALERDRLFAATWTCIGHACTIRCPWQRCEPASRCFANGRWL